MDSDRRLDHYRRRRALGKTPEPRGDESDPGEADDPVFVVQKHAASTLHYDVRLAVDGVLKSWAVPRGPSLDPRDKRLAVPTEDHPMAYVEFEGVIPDGQYGAGTVVVWDRGTYRNLRAAKEGDGADMERSLSEGRVEVWLEGSKLRGGWALVRFRQGDDEAWLLVKMRDEEAGGRDPVRTEPRSVISDRTVEEVARDEGW